MTYAELLKIDEITVAPEVVEIEITELQAIYQARLEETADEPEPFYIEFEL